MREFEYTIDYLNNGLRARGRDRRNSDRLTECFNLVCRSRGLEPFSGFEDPFDGVDLSPAWPFPQLIYTKLYKFLIIRDTVAGEDRLYEVADDWSLTLIIAFDYTTFPIGYRWTVADFEEYIIMTNGSVIVYRDTTTNTFQTVLSLTNTPRCNSYCNFRGQLVGGAVRSTWHSCSTSSIVWSKIGDVDCTPDNKNEAGFRRHPYEGIVYNVFPLESGVIVFGSRGVLSMVPVQEPAPTFGFKELYDRGLYSRYAYGGNKDHVLFVDERGYIFIIDKGMTVKKYGFEEFTSQLGEIVVLHNVNEDEWYISDGEACYVFAIVDGEGRLSEIGQYPSSLVYDDDTLYATYVDSEDEEGRITTDILDLGYRGQKTTEVVELGCEEGGTVSVAIDWRVDKDDALERTDFVEINNEAVSAIRVAATDFRISIKATDFSEFLIDYMKLRFKMSDLRSLRGIYAPPPRGQ